MSGGTELGVGDVDNDAAPAVALDTHRSLALFERLAQTMPGANTRTTTFYPPFPLALERGDGAYVWDVDGNRLIDLVNNYTSLVHGHAAPQITEAIRREAGRGTVFPAPIPLQAELAERLCSRFESVDQVRFTNSGTEAGMHAIRLARAVTGRPLVVKAHFGYHGSWEGLPSSLGDVAGVPEAVLDQLRWVDFNSVADLERVIATDGDAVAAIILEPVLGCGVIPAQAEFLAAARALADRCGALLIFDEVVTARLELHGYQSKLGVRPDVTTFGKLIGGGLPIGAFGGAEELMRRYDPRREASIDHHGTFNGNAVTMAAGVASLDLLTGAEIERINGLGAALAEGMRAAVARHRLDAVITEAGSLVQIHFGMQAAPRCGDDLRPGAEELAALHRFALDQGVYVAPRGELNLTTAMDDDVVREALARLGAALAQVASAV